MLVDRRLLSQFDLQLFALSFVIPLLSLLILYSAGYSSEINIKPISWLPITFHSIAFLKQLVFICAGFIVMLLVAICPTAWLHKIAYFVFAFGILCLVAVLIFGVASKGSVRWLPLGPVRWQPSEVMKIGLILCFARYISHHIPEKGYTIWGLIVPLILLFVPFALVMKQPDLGTAVATFSIGFGMLLFIGIRKKALLILGIFLICSLLPAWMFLLHPYQKQRVLVLLNPEADPLGKGYHIMQSKIAVGSGKFFGTGFMKGTQNQLEFLPEHTTDFVFSVLSEEWGFLGCTIVISLYFLMLLKMLEIASKSRDLFSTLLVIGVTLFLFVHMLINIGMVIGLFPVVGIPLPLFSYGGTSMLMNMSALGLVQGVSMRKYIFAGRM